jgi:digeranylgeranylglycerophospholipid reductase
MQLKKDNMIEGLEKRIVIVGAGPIGLYCAYLIKRNNPLVYVTVIEEHSCVGKPVCCTGHISITGFHKTKLSKLINIKSCVINKIKGANIFGPTKSILKLETNKFQTYVIDRFKFDNLIFNLAKTQNIEFIFNSRVIGVEENYLKIKDLEKNIISEIKYDFLIGADGPNSIIRESIKISSFKNNEFIQAYQIKANGNFNSKLVSVYYSKFSKNFFAWIVPESNNFARIGIGTKLANNPNVLLNKFLEERKIKLNNILFDCSGLIPISKPLSTYCTNNKIIIGDAACFVKATSGGGLNFGLISSEVAANTITKRLKKFKSLLNYNKNISKYKKELNLHYKIYKFLFSKTLIELDEFFIKCKYNNLEKFLENNGEIDYLSSFIFKAIFYPKLYNFIKDFFEFIRIRK